MNDSSPTPAAPQPHPDPSASPPICPAEPASRYSVRRVVFTALAIFFCCVGVWVTLQLSAGHSFRPKDEHSLAGAMCSPKWGEAINCDQVLQSKYAQLIYPVSVPDPDNPGQMKEVKLEIPVAWLGLAYFTSLLVGFLFVGQPSWSHRYYHVLPLAIVVPGVLGSIGFLILLLGKLHANCPLCIATHIANFLVLICTFLLWPPRPAPGRVEAPYPNFGHASTAIVLMVVVSLGVVMRMRAAQNAAMIPFYEKQLREFTGDPRVMWMYTLDQLRKEKVHTIPIDADDPVIGPATAKRTLVIFSDFQCPACRGVHQQLTSPQTLAALQHAAANEGGIKIVFKHYPLYTRCNKRADTNMHAFACEAARAAEAARMVGGNEAFWKMADALFANQDEFYRHPYTDLARQIGLDPAKFEEAMRSDAAAERVARDVKEGADADMTGTPGMYLDGVQVRGIAPSGLPKLMALNPWPPASQPSR